MTRVGADGRRRCDWAGDDPLYVAYHDEEWGVPVHDDHRLFEMLVLEGAQAGLSWITILRKRARYREVYAGFDPAKVARFNTARNAKLLEDPGIVRNRLKVAAAVDNARAFLRVQEEHGSFDRWLWDFVDGEPIVNRPRSVAELPARTPLSDRIGKALKQRGFRFVGSTIVQAFLQAVGVVDDHLADCHVAQSTRDRTPARRGATPR
ncbi:MAG: DNA-3-methyladenine glycosylase I [Planctomycetes bacterium]|nr:DNA-3-methyladenine glycosylase I [Planctomycetota bacterium]